MNKLVLSALLIISGVQASSATLEILNVQAWSTYLKLENNLTATQKELGPKPKGFFSSMSRKMFNSKPKNDAQVDLNELAQIYGTLNTADIAVLSFLKRNCQDGGLLVPATDPLLCQEYPEILLKQLQNRLDVINSKVVHSDGILRTPPTWLYHLITASELLKEIDSRNAMEHRIRQAVGRSISPEDSKEFDANPNILNEAKSADNSGIVEPVPQPHSQLPVVEQTQEKVPSHIGTQVQAPLKAHVQPSESMVTTNQMIEPSKFQNVQAAPSQQTPCCTTQIILPPAQQCPSTSSEQAISPIIRDLTQDELLLML